MQCPNDGTPLVMTDRSGVEIDYCPQCRGVWLDRGELDKIIERSAAMTPPPAPQPHAAQVRKGDYVKGHGGYAKPRKKKDGIGSLIGEIFDF